MVCCWQQPSTGVNPAACPCSPCSRGAHQHRYRRGQGGVWLRQPPRGRLPGHGRQHAQGRHCRRQAGQARGGRGEAGGLRHATGSRGWCCSRAGRQSCRASLGGVIGQRHVQTAGRCIVACQAGARADAGIAAPGEGAPPAARTRSNPGLSPAPPWPAGQAGVAAAREGRRQGGGCGHRVRHRRRRLQGVGGEGALRRTSGRRPCPALGWPLREGPLRRRAQRAGLWPLCKGWPALWGAAAATASCRGRAFSGSRGGGGAQGARASSRRRAATCSAPPPPQAGDKIEAFDVIQKTLKLEEAKAATADMTPDALLEA